MRLQTFPRPVYYVNKDRTQGIVNRFVRLYRDDVLLRPFEKASGLAPRHSMRYFSRPGLVQMVSYLYVHTPNEI